MRASSLDASLAWLASCDGSRFLSSALRGFEKESLRVTADGRLSAADHSPAWGSALTHPFLTTDYSEALLEFVTPPYTGVENALAFLDELQAFVLQSAGEELLWPCSMPCLIDSDDAVPIARYGSSNEGLLRSVYRSGLGYRYGRAMQAIAGVHFNFSLPDSFWQAYREFRSSDLGLAEFKSASMMALIRNFRRYGWLVTYLYGASPAFARSFRPAGHARLEPLGDDTWFAPYATSLRMSDLGYRNSTQARLSISANSLEDYLSQLERALTRREPRYEAIGIRVDGSYRQLNANLLQLENEYYSSIRPKPASRTPRLITALAESGVEYVEVRTIDLDPFDSRGISAGQAGLVEALLMLCLLGPSEPITADEQAVIDERELLVAWEGRRPGLELDRGDGRPVRLTSLASDLIDALARVADVIDADGRHRSAVAAAREAVAEPDRTLSARVLRAVVGADGSFFSFALAAAETHKRHYLDFRFAEGRRAELEALAEESLREAKLMERAGERPFDEFLADYLERGITESTDRGGRICE